VRTAKQEPSSSSVRSLRTTTRNARFPSSGISARFTAARRGDCGAGPGLRTASTSAAKKPKPSTSASSSTTRGLAGYQAKAKKQANLDSVVEVRTLVVERRMWLDG
jgi:hypothetical protein